MVAELPDEEARDEVAGLLERVQLHPRRFPDAREIPGGEFRDAFGHFCWARYRICPDDIVEVHDIGWMP
ncbi:hypothetical protein [Streptomyces sp. 3N207]|uniref:hypothetical protein n=1 Tax=Streptomyces sp. 3N207 TaxID=3457417 RepID=UPI003FD13B24